MTLIRNKIAGYYGQVWEKELMNIAQAVLAVAALSDHVLILLKVLRQTLKQVQFTMQNRQHLVIWQVVLV